MLKVRDFTSHLETIAPLAYQESYDNSGLIVGSPDWDVKGILISLDCTEEIIDEAISSNCNLVIAHHPVIFKGLKKLVPKGYVEKTVIKAIKNDVAIYAIHTNLDNVVNGVNFKIAEKLNLQNTTILDHKKQILHKLVTFVPADYSEKVLNALFQAGAGSIGNYQNCSFKLEGTGSFKPNESANPFIGEAGKTEYVKESRLEVIYPAHLSNVVLKNLLQAHPYETPAYDIHSLENNHLDVGSGAIGNLSENMSEENFLKHLKKSMNLDCIKHTRFTGKLLTKIAICGGSGSFLLHKAMREKADVFITADFKYHEFFDSEGQLLIADIGHYESEVFTKDLIFDILNKKFSNIAILLSNVNTNPIQYFY